MKVLQMLRAGNEQNGIDRAGALFRIYMGGNAILTWWIVLTEKNSLMHSAAHVVDGKLLAWLLMIVGVAACADTIINDFLPRRFHWRVALRQRHFILALMAFCYVAQLCVAVSGGRSSIGLIAYYLWNAVNIMFVSYIDANQRSTDASCQTVCS